MKAIKKTMMICAVLVLIQQYLQAQENNRRVPGLAVEARVTTYLQSGYDLGLYYYPHKTKFSFGLLVAGHDIEGQTKEWLFESSNYEAIDIRLNWIVSVLSRYHFSSHGEGLFGEIGIGLEEFAASYNEGEISNTNGFIAPSIGYIWYPWKRSGFYLLPKATGAIILSRPEEQMFASGDNFRIKPAFVTPSIAIGWKFDFRNR